MKSTGNTMVLATILFATTGIGNAYAVDAKTVSGNSCQAHYGSQIADFNNYGSGIQNITGFRRIVVCPIVRDNRGNTNGIRSMFVYIVQPTGTSTSCTLMAKNINGNTVEPGNTRTLNGSGRLSLKVNQSVVNGSYSLLCKLGGRAKLTTVYWDEY